MNNNKRKKHTLDVSFKLCISLSTGAPCGQSQEAEIDLWARTQKNGDDDPMGILDMRSCGWRSLGW